MQRLLVLRKSPGTRGYYYLSARLAQAAGLARRTLLAWAARGAGVAQSRVNITSAYTRAAAATINDLITINVNDFERHILIKMCKLHFSRFSGYQFFNIFDTISISEFY